MIGDSIMCAGHSQVVIINGSKIQFFDNNSRIPVAEIDTGDDGTNNKVICSSISCDERYFVYSNEMKMVCLWRFDRNKWNLVSKRQVNKRPTCILFTRDSQQMLIADKAGFVSRMSVKESDEKGQVCLGHISIILCMAITPNNNYLLTGDRDEKIRISNYPHTYDISGFCLGHTEFVTSITILDDTLMISGSGDGTIKLWNFLSCRLLQSIDMKELWQQQQSSHLQDQRYSDGIISCVTYCPKYHVVAISYEDVKVVILCNVNIPKSKVTFMQKIELSGIPIKMSFVNQSLWILISNTDVPFEIYKLSQDNTTDSVHASKVPIEYANDSIALALKGDYLQDCYNTESYFLQVKRKRIGSPSNQSNKRNC